MNIQELKKDLEELNCLYGQATRSRVKDVLTLAKHRIETDIINLEIKEKAEIEKSISKILDIGGITPSTSGTPASAAHHANKRYLVELNGYAWDQSDKFVKIFVTLEGVNKLTESNITTQFTENSMHLLIRNLNNKDYSLIIKNLHSKVVIEKSYHKIKTDMVAIYMKKHTEAENWSHLTLTEKRAKEMQDELLKKDQVDVKDDPFGGLMSLMQKMYQNGDSETKKMISKAWTESTEKQRKLNNFN